MTRVRLTTRPSRDGTRFTYVLEYRDDNKERVRRSLGHADKGQALKQKNRLERELLTVPTAEQGTVGPLKLSAFWKDWQERTRGQIRQSSMAELDIAMRDFMRAVGNIDLNDVQLRHGERFLQACLDRGNTLATARKKIAGLKRVFRVAVDREQIETHPFEKLGTRKPSQQEIHIYSDDECHRLIKAARNLRHDGSVNWPLLISMALCTGMRRGELLNLTWRDIDFFEKLARVSEKKDTEGTWPWLIKDAEKRQLPVTDEIIGMLLGHQEQQPEGYPYVFVPPERYDHIQHRRRQRTWTLSDGRCPINNFKRRFDHILCPAGIERGTFHDLRRTCLTRWFENGLSEYEVMVLAGHSNFETTRRFHLRIRRDHLERARAAAATAAATEAAARAGDLVTRLSRAPNCVSPTSGMET